MTGGECASSTFAVNQDVAEVARDSMLLLLRDVVADVVDEMKLRILPEDPPEGSAQKVKNCLAIRPSEIRGRGHRGQIRAAFRRPDRHTCKLPVRNADPVLVHRVAHLRQIVRADLMAQTSRSAMDQNHNLMFRETHGRRRFLVMNLLDVLDLQEM